jgi:hypothetical protein
LPSRMGRCEPLGCCDGSGSCRTMHHRQNRKSSSSQSVSQSVSLETPLEGVCYEARPGAVRREHTGPREQVEALTLAGGLHSRRPKARKAIAGQCYTGVCREQLEPPAALHVKYSFRCCHLLGLLPPPQPSPVVPVHRRWPLCPLDCIVIVSLEQLVSST